jgi:diacylglycerol kinase family enzyme
MRATLLHNKRAGTRPDAHPKKELLKLLRGAGYKVDYQSTRKPGMRQALQDPGDLIVIAGGDGAVGNVLRCLERRDVPVLLLPLGTANNIATSLGVTGTPAAIVNGLQRAVPRRLDMGVARSAGGDRQFVESAGLGLFAEFLKLAAAEDSGSPANHLELGMQLFHQLASRARSRRCRINVDGNALSGRYLLAMAFNTGRVGPGLALAPKAEPGDGKLDLLLIGESQRGTLRQYLSELRRGAAPEFPFPLTRARRIRMSWAVGAGHLDDRVWPNGELARQGMVTLEVAGPPFEVLVP